MSTDGKRKFLVPMSVYVEVEVDAKHLAELMSEEWQSHFYQFDFEEEALAYLARLHLMFDVGEVKHKWDTGARDWLPRTTKELRSLDGHADQGVGVMIASIQDATAHEYDEVRELDA